MSNTQQINKYITPLSDINNFIKAIIIIDKIYCKTKKNYKQITECITQLVQPVEQSDITKLVQNIFTYQDLYPFEIISNFQQFTNDVISFSIEGQEQSSRLLNIVSFVLVLIMKLIGSNTKHLFLPKMQCCIA